MTHDRAWERLPDLLLSHDDQQLLAHVSACHVCQRQLFLLSRVDRVLRHASAQRCGSELRGLGGALSRFVIVAAPIACVAFAMVVLTRAPRVDRLALRTADKTVAHATITRIDRSNAEVSLVARRLPRMGGDRFLLWAQPAERVVATRVGEFMVDDSGACRAHFNLPAGQRWLRLWVTPASDPSVVVAAT